MHPPIARVRGPRQGLRPRSCAHIFSAGFAPLAPKNPSFSMRRLPRACPNMPTDRKLGPEAANAVIALLARFASCFSLYVQFHKTDGFSFEVIGPHLDVKE